MLLELSYNNLQYIEAFMLPYRLVFLYMHNNDLIHIAFTLTKLKIVTLSHNVLHYSTLPNIRQNPLSSIWTNLWFELDLSYNHIYNMYENTLDISLSGMKYLYITYVGLQNIGPLHLLSFTT